ncbi:hypothetical protein PAMP_007860 [Pampus punctatissimus]
MEERQKGSLRKCERRCEREDGIGQKEDGEGREIGPNGRDSFHTQIPSQFHAASIIQLSSPGILYNNLGHHSIKVLSSARNLLGWQRRSDSFSFQALKMKVKDRCTCIVCKSNASCWENTLRCDVIIYSLLDPGKVPADSTVISFFSHVPFIVFPRLASPAPPLRVEDLRGDPDPTHKRRVDNQLPLSSGLNQYLFRIPMRCHAFRNQSVTHYPSSTQPLIPNLWLSYPCSSVFCAAISPHWQLDDG